MQILSHSMLYQIVYYSGSFWLKFSHISIIIVVIGKINFCSVFWVFECFKFNVLSVLNLKLLFWWFGTQNTAANALPILSFNFPSNSRKWVLLYAISDEKIELKVYMTSSSLYGKLIHVGAKILVLVISSDSKNYTVIHSTQSFKNDVIPNHLCTFKKSSAQVLRFFLPSFSSSLCLLSFFLSHVGANILILVISSDSSNYTVIHYTLFFKNDLVPNHLYTLNKKVMHIH